MLIILVHGHGGAWCSWFSCMQACASKLQLNCAVCLWFSYYWKFCAKKEWDEFITEGSVQSRLLCDVMGYAVRPGLQSIFLPMVILATVQFQWTQCCMEDKKGSFYWGACLGTDRMKQAGAIGEAIVVPHMTGAVGGRGVMWVHEVTLWQDLQILLSGLWLSGVMRAESSIPFEARWFWSLSVLWVSTAGTKVLRFEVWWRNWCFVQC